MARHYLAMAGQLGIVKDKARMKALAACWMEQAEKADQQLQQQQQIQSKRQADE